MKQGTSRRFAAMALVVGVAHGCHTDSGADDPESLTKVTPAAVSTPAAWSLFDRSVQSSFIPGSEPVRVALDHVAQISAIKVYGSAPYRLRTTGADGGSIGFTPVDLSNLGPGWHVLPSTALVSTNIVQLKFEAVSKATAPVPEIELWAVDDESASTTQVDLAAKELPASYVTIAAKTENAELAPSDCGTFELEISRAPSAFARAHLVYASTGAFRPFVLRRSINGLAEVGGSWMVGDSSARTNVEEIDPAALHLGSNEVSLCVPNNATQGVAISNVHIVAELDTGVNLGVDATAGTNNRDARAAIDRDPATTIDVAAGERLVVDFARLIAPDAMEVSGPAKIDPRAISSAECIDRAGKSSALSSQPQTGAPATWLRLDGAAQSCSAVAVTFAVATTVGSIDIIGSGAAEPIDWAHIVVSSPSEHFGATAWVAGFLQRPAEMTGAVRVDVGGSRAEAMTGDFGSLVGRDAESAAAWPMAIVATLPDGSKQTKQIVLDKDMRSQLNAAAAQNVGTSSKSLAPDAMFGHVGATTLVRANKLSSVQIRLGTRVGVDVPAGAVRAPTDITVRHLDDDAVPPLDPGMINVTAPKGHGFEFLPHGQHFARQVEVVVPYDPSLIPDGMSPEDVRTFFFDPTAARWKKLDRHTIDVGDKLIRSGTDHFTIMIDAVLAVPKNTSPLSLDPTSMSSIGAASPAANIDMIESPQANSSGDARLSLPIRLPKGRGAYMPSLGIGYSSSSGNGWLGMGWDLSTSRIEIDTRWGVPTYDPAEEPRYVLDGAELVPTLESEGPSCASGTAQTRYHTRIEGGFAHILRCDEGTAQAHSYHWEVHDRDGTLYVYGVSNQTTGSKASLVSYANANAIFRWDLAKVIDVRGNATTFEYASDDIAPSSGEPSTERYPAVISYSSHPSLPDSPYTVEFQLDDGTRPDQIVSGRAGFKTVTRHLLRSIVVKFRGSVIRQYVLEYEHGEFDKSVLSSVSVYGLGGCNTGMNAFAPPSCTGAAFFNRHSFDYFQENAEFSPPVMWDVAGDPTGGDAPLGKGNTETGGLSAGVSTPSANGVGAGIGISGSLGTRDELIGMYDVDGDGLPDQIIRTGPITAPTISVLYNQSKPGYPTSSPLFMATTKGVTGLAALGKDDQEQWGVNASVSGVFGGGGPSLSAGFSNSTSKAARFLGDLDGDGFLDVIDASGNSLRGQPCDTGTCFSSVPFGTATAVDPQSNPTLNQLKSDIESRLVIGDPVLQWVAPFDGTIQLSGSVQKVNAGGRDGVTIEAYHQSDFVDGITIGPDNVNSLTFPSATSIDVSAGDAIYVRLKTGSDDGITVDGTLHDLVNTDLSIRYSRACTQFGCGDITNPDGFLDPTARSVFSYESKTDLNLAGLPAPLIAPTRGTIALHAFVDKEPSTSDVRLCVQRFPSVAEQSGAIDVPCATTGSGIATFASTTIPAATGTFQQIDASIDVEPGEMIVVRAEGDLSFDPAKLKLLATAPGVPLAQYTTLCEPDKHVKQWDCTSDPATTAAFPLRTDTFGVFVPTSAEPPGIPFVAAETGTLHVADLSAPSQPFLFAVRSDVQGILVYQDCSGPVSCSGTISVPPLTIVEGETLSFDLVTADGSGLASTTAYYTDPHALLGVPISVHSFGPPPVKTPFAGGYRGFRVAIWNENVPFDAAQLLDDLGNAFVLQDTDRMEQIRRTITTPQPYFGGTGVSGTAPTWLASGSFAFVDASAMHAAHLGGGVGGSGAPSDAGGLYAANYARLSSTSSLYIGASIQGVPSLDASASQSRTDTTTDTVDVNGDGIVDLVQPKGAISGALSPAFGPEIQSFVLDNTHVSGVLRHREGKQYSIGFGGKAVVCKKTNAGGRCLDVGNDDGPDTGFLGLSTGAGLGINRSQTTLDLEDINGDGLPDQVWREGTTIMAKLNLGGHFGVAEVYGHLCPEMLAPVDDFESGIEHSTLLGGALDSTSNALNHETTLTQDEAGGFNLAGIIDFSASAKQSSTRTTRQLADINGDGLPDLLYKRDLTPDGDQDGSTDGVILVQINRGSDFAPPIVWPAPAWNVPLETLTIDAYTHLRFGNHAITGSDVLAGTGSEDSVSASGLISIPIIPDILNLNLGFSGGHDNDTYELALMDIDGDGAADHVLRRAEGVGTKVYVKYNQITGKTNLLKAVHGPLGATYRLDYERVGHTIDMPQSREVLSHVEVDDGVELGAGFESPDVVTNYTYADGVYQRNEKEFYGFGRVTTFRPDGVTIEDDYNSDPTSYPLHGKLQVETRRDAGGRMFHQHSTQYTALPVLDASGSEVTIDSRCLANIPGLLARQPDACVPLLPIVTVDTDTLAEGGTTTKSHIITDAAADHDRFGNVTASLDAGDDAIESDDTYAHVTYSNDTAQWIIGRPTSIEVRAGGPSGTVLRARSGDYNNFGEVAAIHVETGSGTATSTLGYDAFGNLTHLQTPPNEAGQSQTYDVTFDSDIATYPVVIQDGFGYRSTAQYDLGFGVALIETDTNGESLTRALDAFGRLSAVRGPYDLSAAGLTMEYHPDEPLPRAVTVMRTAAPADYTGSLPAPLTSVAVTDGLGRAIEMRKTAVVDAAVGMTTSGFVARDAVGHIVSTYNPFFTTGPSTAFAGPQATEVTRTTFDSMDRPVFLQYADGATESTSFSIATAPTSATLFLTAHSDPNGHPRETYVDQLGRTRAFVEHPTSASASISKYDYDALGELTQIIDAEGHITGLAYDERGLRTSLNNPDDGLIEDQYDLMGNRIALIEPNHRALGTRVHFVFERDRLTTIDYPSKPDVTFMYGPVGAPNFTAGRVALVADESGTQQHFYGAMGEVRRTIRTVVPDQQGSQNQIFDLRFTFDSFGRQLQIGYPDGELVTNTYDAGGQLQQVVGAGTGWSQTYASDVRYDVFGNRTQLRFGNGVVTRSNFDPQRIRLSTLTTTLPSQVKVQDLRYTYDRASNPTKIENALPQLAGGSATLPGQSTLTLGYDDVDRLTDSVGTAQLDAQKTTTYDQQLVYSASHNILHKQRLHQITTNGGSTQTPSTTNFASDYTYAGRPHLPTQIGDLVVTYDPSGNPLTRNSSSTGSRQNLTWDDANRLVDFTQSGVHQHNTFDSSGLRVRRKSTQSETIYSSPYFDLENGTQGVKHVFAGGIRVASKLNKFTSGANPTTPSKQGTTYYFHGDHLRSTHVVTDDNALVQESLEFFTDGEQWINRGPQKPVTGYLFSGKPYDPDTGLYDFGDRFYDPRVGLWLGVDRLVVDSPNRSIGQPITLAAMAFAALSPIRYSDKTGRGCNWTDAGGGGQQCRDDDTGVSTVSFYPAGQGLGEAAVYDSSLGYRTHYGQDLLTLPARLVGHVANKFYNWVSGLRNLDDRLKDRAEHAADAPFNGGQYTAEDAQTDADMFALFDLGGAFTKGGGALRSGPIAGATRLLPEFSKSTIDGVLESSRRLRPTGKITEGARAIAKKAGHAESGGFPSAFDGVAPTQANAEAIIRSTLEKPARTFFGDKVIDVYNATGQGVRFDRGSNVFRGFIEAGLEKK